MLRRPFVLLCVGAEPVRNPLTRRLFVATVALAEHVSYRDDWSASAMRLLGGREADAVAADLVFARPPEATRTTAPRVDPGRVVVGLMDYHGVDGDPVAGGAAHRAYLSRMAEVVLALVDAGDRVVLVGGDDVDTRATDRVLQLIAAARPDLDGASVRVSRASTFEELTEEMAGADAAVVTRFHNLICALRLGVPVVSIGYADKNARLLKDLALDGFSQPIESLDPGLVLAQLHRARSAWPTARAGRANGRSGGSGDGRAR